MYPASNQWGCTPLPSIPFLVRTEYFIQGGMGMDYLIELVHRHFPGYQHASLADQVGGFGTGDVNAQNPAAIPVINHFGPTPDFPEDARLAVGGEIFLQRPHILKGHP